MALGNTNEKSNGLDMSSLGVTKGENMQLSATDRAQQLRRVFDWDEDAKMKKRGPRTLKGTLHQFAETSSFQGLPHINASKSWYGKSLWTIFFLAACGMAVYQLIDVFEAYFRRETSSSVKLGYANLDFPSVTLCNLNPIRKSQINQTPPSFQSFLGKLHVDANVSEENRNVTVTLTEISEPQTPSAPTAPPGRAAGNEPTTQPGGKDKGKGKSSQKSPNLNETDTQPGRKVKDKGKSSQKSPNPNKPDFQPKGKNKSKGKSSKKSWKPTKSKPKKKDLIKANFGPDRGYNKWAEPERSRETEEEYGAGARSTSHKIMEGYTEQLVHVPQDTREAIGHQKETFILKCTFNGRDCSAGNFSQFWIREYGNCYTFNSQELRRRSIKSIRVGTQYGLRLVLYTEAHEVIEGLSQGRGARMDIHPYHTMPFPLETGMSLAPGFESSVGMRMINITRVRNPLYGGCEEGDKYTDHYNKKYTVEGCVNACEDKLVAEKCNCRRSAFPSYYNQEQLTSLPSCQTDEQEKCMWERHHEVNGGKMPCSCHQACNEENFDLVSSSNLWPTPDLWGALVDLVCDEDEAGCYTLQENVRKSTEAGTERNIAIYNSLRENFMAVNVYYRDLNYQNIEQKIEYEMAQFLSDIGGTVGLWIGASILSAIEVLEFLILLLTLCCRKARN